MARELQTRNEQNKLALWAERVNACRSSGRTVKDWCKESGISEQTYYRWQKRLFEMARQQQEERFAEITPERVEHWDEIKTDSPPIWVLHLCFYLGLTEKLT